MAGITVTRKTKSPNTLRLINEINSYIFEQECNELRGQDKLVTSLRNIVKKLNKLL